MKLERLGAGMCILLTLYQMYSFFLLLFHSTFKMLPLAELYIGTRGAIVKKYPISIGPSASMLVVAWPSITITSLLSACGLVYYIANKQIYNFEAYICWMSASLATSLWTYTTDRQHHKMSLLLVAIVCCSCTVTFVQACRHSFIRQMHPGAKRWWTETIFLDFLGIVTSWTYVVIAATLSFALYYKGSFELAKPEFVGWFDLDTCETISLCIPVLGQMMWTVSDIYLYPSYTERMRTAYPFFAFFMLGIFAANYEPTNGFTRNNALCFGMSTVAFITFLFRNFLRGSIGHTPANKSKSS